MDRYEGVQTIRDLIRKAGNEYKETAFMRYIENEKNCDITYEVFVEQCEAVAAWVAEKSYEVGHPIRVGIMGPNSCPYVTLLLGIIYGGGISIPTDPQMELHALCACINKAEEDILIVDESLNLDMDEIRRRCPGLSGIMLMKESESILSGYTEAGKLLDVKSSDCAVILFTSGTTGEEKGVMLSNGNLIDSAYNTSHEHHYIKLNVLPLHHAFCINADVIINFTAEATTCFNGDISKLGENLQLFRPTFMNMVPRVAQLLYDKVHQLALQTGCSESEIKDKVFGDRLRRIITGGAHLPAELVEKYHNLGIFLCQGYGMTECSPTIASPVMERPDKAHTAGHVVEGCVTRVVKGELQVKSPAVMMGYVNAPELTAEVITEDGWLRTGDMGYEDEEGYLHITGRLKNLIILANGENVSPEQIENCLLDHQLIEECLVYGEGNSIVAEIYPSENYIALNQVSDVSAAIDRIVAEVNKSFASYKHISKYLIRKIPLKRTGVGKIIRSQRATEEELLIQTVEEYRLPENNIQQQMYDCLTEILGYSDFGIDSDLFEAGMDSMVGMQFMTAMEGELEFIVDVNELIDNNTIEKLEQLYHRKCIGETEQTSVQQIYPLTAMQERYVYHMRGNKMMNLSVLLQLGKVISIHRLQKAIYELFEIHPVLKNVIQMTEQGYANCRDDNREVHIPIIDMTEAQWEEHKKNLIRPYMYEENEPLYHIEIYRVGGKKYLFFDIAHAINDGMGMTALLEDFAALYMGKKLEKDKYTLYDYLLEEKEMQAKADKTYYAKLMKGYKVDRAVLIRGTEKERSEPRNMLLKGPFKQFDRKKVQEFCDRNRFTENALFNAAFAYCICLYGDVEETLIASVHGGRTDSRWVRAIGDFVKTYAYRCGFDNNQKLVDVVRSLGHQMMKTMGNGMHAGSFANDFVFQYQGEMYEAPKAAHGFVKVIPLEELTNRCQFLVKANQKGYSYEYRFIENRFAKEQQEQLIVTLEAVIKAMLEVELVGDIYDCLPKEIFSYDTKEHRILDRFGRIQPTYAWGILYQGNHNTGKIARIMEDNSIDYLENCGREMLSGIRNPITCNYQILVEELLTYSGICDAVPYLRSNDVGIIELAVDIRTDGIVDIDNVMSKLKDKMEPYMVPAEIIVR